MEMFEMSDHKGGHTLVCGTTVKGKSLMPDSSPLTVDLATKAFEMLGRSRFEVSADLRVEDTDGLWHFGEFQSILLMAYREGAAAMQAQAQAAIAGLSESKWVNIEAAGECQDVISQIEIDKLGQ